MDRLFAMILEITELDAAGNHSAGSLSFRGTPEKNIFTSGSDHFLWRVLNQRGSLFGPNDHVKLAC
jgi:hypothetical protein